MMHVLSKEIIEAEKNSSDVAYLWTMDRFLGNPQ